MLKTVHNLREMQNINSGEEILTLFPLLPLRYELSTEAMEDDGEEVVLAVYMRERPHYRDYGSGNSYGTSLFGHPLLMAVPREQCTRDALYHLFLQRLA